MPSEKYRGKYRIPSSRLNNYDYGKNGAYFVTIVTENRQNFFGEIQNGKMVLSEMGKMAKKYWYEIPQHFPFVRLDAFVIMPNHIHGILWIVRDKQPGNILKTGAGKMDGNDGNDGIGGLDGNDGNDGIVETPNLGVSTDPTDPTDRMYRMERTERPEQPPRPGQSVPTKNRNKNHRPEWKPGTLGVIINQYKRICTIQMRKKFPGFGWQSRFHDRIIRNKEELNRIRRYIRRNPEIWWRDRNNPDR